MGGYFDFEWSGRCDARDEKDILRGIDAAEAYCDARGINPAELWSSMLADDSAACDLWLDVEFCAIEAMCRDWWRPTENATLTWREGKAA